jgi:hypothetical protein
VKRIVILSLLASLATPILPASAAYGLTNLVISKENPKSNDIFTVEFEVSRPIGIDQKYQNLFTYVQVALGQARAHPHQS